MTGTGLVVALRADAGPTIGTGHAMRCLALGQAVHDVNGRAFLVTASAADTLLDRFAAEGIDVLGVAAAHPDRRDAAETTRHAEAIGASWIAVDGQHFDEAFHAAVGRERHRILAIDDMARLPRYDVEAVLNQNAHADQLEYHTRLSTRRLFGTRYAVLRREFAATAGTGRDIPERGRRLLVTFGGSDPSGMTVRTIEALAAAARARPGAVDGLEIRVVVGGSNPSRSGIERAIAETGLQVMLVADVRDMTEPMRWADLAITAGGSTIWELAALGTPAIVVETAPPERFLVAGLRTLGLYHSLGNEADLDPADLADEVTLRLADRQWRRTMSERGRSVVDGRGGQRVVAALVASMEVDGQPGG